mgnify:CR=1 FL=1
MILKIPDGMLYLFPGLFFILFSYFSSFMAVWGFRVGVLDWVFGVGVSVAGVWGLLCFLGWCSLCLSFPHHK